MADLTAVAVKTVKCNPIRSDDKPEGTNCPRQKPQGACSPPRALNGNMPRPDWPGRLSFVAESGLGSQTCRGPVGDTYQVEQKWRRQDMGKWGRDAYVEGEIRRLQAKTPG